MNTHDIDIELPPLPEPFTYTLPGKSEGALYHAGHMQDYACAAVEADRKRRREPTAAEISDVVREITGCPDIKSGEKSLVVALGMLFHSCAAPQPAEPVTLECPKCGVDRAKEPCAGNLMDCEFKGVAHAAEPVKVPSDEHLIETGCYQTVIERHSQPAASADPVAHTDDDAVDHFAAAMKAKLAQARAKGRHGWQECDPSDLSQMLRAHVEKGDPRDVANFCMFLWSLGQPISAAPVAQEPAFYVNKSIIDPRTGKLRGGFNDAITWSDEPAHDWRLPVFLAPVAAQAQPAPMEAIGKLLTVAMEIAVANGANSVSMPDEYVEVAAWLFGIPVQHSAQDREDAYDIEAAAKTLAECMDYPWEPMPEKGREAMRNHAKRVIAAARAAKGE